MKKVNKSINIEDVLKTDIDYPTEKEVRRDTYQRKKKR